jgi:hypothetical protein
MGRPKKPVEEEILEIGKLEFVFEPGFDNDWAEVLASYIFFQIKGNLKKDVDNFS